MSSRTRRKPSSPTASASASASASAPSHHPHPAAPRVSAMRPNLRASAALLLASCALALAGARCADAVHVVRNEVTFPIYIPLVDNVTDTPISRPVGVVAGLDTAMIVATETGQLYMADIRSGSGYLLNVGGDTQHFGGLCIDSRPPGTLYATGRETGKLYAFNRRGELIVQYQITKPKSADNPTGSFLSGCRQSRHHLYITDSYNPWLYYLKLADEGEMRGRPPVPSNTQFQGYLVKYGGDWKMEQGPSIKAYGVEWTQLYNETVYVMDSKTGELFATDADEQRVDGTMEKVEITGAMTTFKGALDIKFDSVNERIMYIAMPHFNGIAVIEFSHTNPLVAVFIRILTNTLTQGPTAIGEYGDYLYPTSGNFVSKDSTYSLVRLSRHSQILNSSGDEFTTAYNDVVPDETIYVEQDVVEEAVQKPPPVVGFDAPAPLSNPEYSPSLSEPPTPSPTPSEGAVEVEVTASATPELGEDTPERESGSGTVSTFSSAASSPTPVASSGQGSCFPADATVTLRNGRVVRMDELRIGDEVLVERTTGADSAHRYSAVFVFSHSDPTALAPFVRIVASARRDTDEECGEMLDMTEGHYLYVNGKLAAAGSVLEGDELTLGDGRKTRVRQVSRVWRRGLYNPQTLDGTLVVNGIRVSAYTTAVAPRAACALLAPLRGLFAWTRAHGLLRRVSSALERGNPTGVWLPSAA